MNFMHMEHEIANYKQFAVFDLNTAQVVLLDLGKVKTRQRNSQHTHALKYSIQAQNTFEIGTLILHKPRKYLKKLKC